jgi:hypothetical protein
MALARESCVRGEEKSRRLAEHTSQQIFNDGVLVLTEFKRSSYAVASCGGGQSQFENADIRRNILASNRKAK